MKLNRLLGTLLITLGLLHALSLLPALGGMSFNAVGGTVIDTTLGLLVLRDKRFAFPTAVLMDSAGALDYTLNFLAYISFRPVWLVATFIVLDVIVGVMGTILTFRSFRTSKAV